MVALLRTSKRRCCFYVSKMLWATVMAIYSATFERVSLSNDATLRGEAEQKFERVEACVRANPQTQCLQPTEV